MELLCLIGFGVLFVGISNEADVDSDLFTYEKTPVYEEWKGKYSPEEKIRSSGMWLKQGLAK